MPLDPSSVKLGKKLGHVEDPRTLRLANLLTPDLPKPPFDYQLGRGFDVPMFANDQYGDCTCVSHGHRILVQERHARQRETPISTDDVLAAYSAVTGFDPDRPETDNGAYMLDVLNYMRRTGMGREKDGTRHQITAYAKVDHTDLQEVRTAIALFGGLYIGIWLPLSAQWQDLMAWDLPSEGDAGDGTPGSWGGHAVYANGYDRRGVDFYTWSEPAHMTWEFWTNYVDEAYAVISEDFFRKTGKSSRGFDTAQLNAFLRGLG
jgi:hypothetical protein